MKISRETMTKKLQYVKGRLNRRPDLTLAEIQRRLVRRFGHRLSHPTLRTAVRDFFAAQGRRIIGRTAVRGKA